MYLNIHSFKWTFEYWNKQFEFSDIRKLKNFDYEIILIFTNLNIDAFSNKKYLFI